MSITLIFWVISILILVIGIFSVLRRFNKNQKEEVISDVLIAGGLQLILASFGNFDDKFFAFLSGTQSTTNYIQLTVGFTLLVGGILFFFYVKNKIYILNINGYFDKRIEQHHHDLGLNDFQFKEREIDFIHLFKKEMNEAVAVDILELIKNKTASFIEESKDKNRAYTGIAPIPFIFSAGKFFSREKIDKYFEYNKFNQTYYELKPSKKRKMPYPLLQTITPMSTVSDDFSENVVLAISLTQKIEEVDLLQFSYPIIHLSIPNPTDNAIKYSDQLKNYTLEIYSVLINIKKYFPRVKRVHIVYSGQSCLPFEVGKLLDDQRMIEVVSYQYTAQNIPRYSWGIIINGANKGTYIKE